LRNIKIHLN